MHKRKISIYCYLVSVAFIIGLLSISIFIGYSKESTSSAKDDNQLEYVTPEEVGYSSEKLNETKQFAKQSGYAAMMVLYNVKFFFMG